MYNLHDQNICLLSTGYSLVEILPLNRILFNFVIIYVRFKLILGHLQIDNQLPLTLMPVLLAPEQATDMHHPVFKMTITVRNENTEGIQVYPYVYIRVMPFVS